MNMWRGTASIAASTLASLTPCLATRATIALRTASETSGAWRLAVGIGVGKVLRAAGLPSGCAACAWACALAAWRPESCAALRVAVCGVTTVRVGAAEERFDVLVDDLLVFSTTEDKDNGKRLGLPVMPTPFANWPVAPYASNRSARA